LPIPENSRGSVSARLSVWRSAPSRAAKACASAESASKPPGIVAGQLRLALHQVQRGAPVAGRLGQPQRPVREVERRQRQAAWQGHPRRLPAQAPGDHQVHDGEPLSGEDEHDPLAQAPQAHDLATGERRRGQGHRAQDERAEHAQAAQAPADDPRLQGVDVRRDVGKLGHLRYPA